MKKEIEKIIAENLPSMAAGQMRKYIEHAEDQASQLQSAKQEITHLEDDIMGWKKKQEEYQRARSYLKKAEDLMAENQAQAQDLQQQEDRINMTLATLRVQMMSENMSNMQQLVTKVFGHPGVTVTSQRKIPVAAHTTGQNGCMEGGEYVEQHEETETKTETKE